MTKLGNNVGLIFRDVLARAASIAAFNANKLACPVMTVITSKILQITRDCATLYQLQITPY
mgnify:CR=1 FL=1|nr:hypothetical protein [Vibrio cyclitrophicus]